ncbi:MAG: lytic transglycosylase domain-containing protein, partial [Nanoarchaeota archaeon]
GINFNLSVVLAQTSGSTGSPQLGNPYDSDGDRICNLERDHADYAGLTSTQLGCMATAYGDLCPGTVLEDDRSVGSGASNSGCGPSQSGRLINFWSVSRGELTPKTLKVNWVIDTRNGVLAYQEVDLIRNPTFSKSNIQLRDIRISCDSGVGIDKSDGYKETSRGFISDSVVVRTPFAQNGSNEKRMIQFRVRQRSDSEVRPKSLISPSGGGVDEIRTTCKVTIDQCERNSAGDCIPVYPVEQDEIDFFIPIDARIIPPPEFALEAGLEFSEDIVKLTTKLIDKFTKVYWFTFEACGYSIVATRAAVFVDTFFKLGGDLSSLADQIWYGYKPTRGVGLQKGTSILSGRAMCAAVACPKDWCKFANIKVGQKQVQEYIDADKDGVKETPVWEQDEKGDPKFYPGENGGITERKIPKLITQDITLGSRAPYIQKSLILSAGCGCVSGILTKLYEIRAIADSWKQCIQKALNGEGYVAQCDKLMNHGICEFVLKELEAFHGTDLFGKLFDFTGGTPGDGEKTNALQETRVAEGLRVRTKDAFNEAKSFGDDDLKVLGESAGGGVLGYQQALLANTICSLALYQRFPNMDAFAGFDLSRPLLKTSVSLNWDSRPLYITPTGARVFEYSVDWMIMAGRRGLRYEVYLETLNGAKSPRIDRQGGFLREPGDYHRDFVQVLDTTDYTRACVSAPDEFTEPRCFPIGGGDNVILDETNLFGTEGRLDIDGDGMPNEWESEMGFNPNDLKDAAGDYDGDGLSNLREYTLGTNPKDNKDPGDKPLGVETTRSDCQAVFNKDIEFIESGRVKPGAIPQYKLGDRIEVNPAGLVTITRPSEGVQVKVQIFDENNNLEKVIRFIAHDIVNGNPFVVWDIPEARVGVDVPNTGLYKFKFSLIKNAGLSDPVCLDTIGWTTNSIIEKKILIYDPAFSGCVDSGGYDITRQKGCISGNNGIQAFVDECSDGKLIEYSCRQEQCIPQVVGCPDGTACQNGECVPRREIVTPAPAAPVTITPTTPATTTGPFAAEPTTGKVFVDTKNNLGYPSGETFVYIKNTVREIFGNEDNLPLILGIITQESKGDKNAVSNAGATGLMQILPGAQKDVNDYLLFVEESLENKNRNIWRDNVYIGVRYFKMQLERFENVELALAAYNGGPTKIANACRKPNGTYKSFEECKSSLPAETQNYVPAVLRHAEAWRREIQTPSIPA